MKLLIKPVNGKSFKIEGATIKKNGVYYINGQSFPEEIVQELKNYKYEGICEERGKVIGSEDAFEYALWRISNGSEEERREFVDWYFSGNWIKREVE